MLLCPRKFKKKKRRIKSFTRVMLAQNDHACITKIKKIMKKGMRIQKSNFFQNNKKRLNMYKKHK